MSRSAPPPPRLRALTARLAHWQQSLDQRSPRERLMMGAVGLALALALGDALWLSPGLAAHQRARAEHRLAQSTQAQLQLDMQRLALQKAQRLQQQRADLATWRARAHQTDAALQAHERMLIGPEQMLGLLEGLLQQQARAGANGAGRPPVRVRGMQSLPRTDLLGAGMVAAGAAAAPPASASAAALPGGPLPSLYRHGVELTLEGGFTDLLAYLNALEALPQRLLWGSLALQVQQHPTSVLTLRLYTLSRDRHWLAL